MYVHVYSLQKPTLEKEVVSVNLKTAQGEITILDNHRPLIAPIAKGVIRITDLKNEEQRIEAEGGLIEVRPKGEVNILIN